MKFRAITGKIPLHIAHDLDNIVKAINSKERDTYKLYTKGQFFSEAVLLYVQKKKKELKIK